jgi:hypothetical protein
MGIALSIEHISHNGDGVADRARKGTNAAHYMKTAPAILGSFSVETACGKTLGSSADSTIEIGVGVPGTLCKRCVKVYADAAPAPEVRENSPAPVAPIASTPAGPERDAAVRALWDSSAAPESAPEAAPVVRELNATDVRAAIRASKRGAARSKRATAVAVERERLDSRVSCPGTGRKPLPGSRVTRDDHTISLPDDYNASKHSGKCPGEGCGRIIAVSREGGMRRHNAPAPAVREDSAPALPGVDAEIVASTGKTLAEMREETAAFYADGGKPSREITTLGMAGKGVVDTTVLVCEFKGDVEIVNPERTHGKCPECTSYIPLREVKSDPDADRIGKHNVGGVATPARKGLSSKALDTVEHGSVPGDPGDADKRRRAESLCEKSGRVARGAKGGVKACTGCARPVELIKIKGKADPSKVTYRYPDHTDARDTFVRSPQGERKVTPRGEGADVGTVRGTGHGKPTAVKGARLAMGRGQGSVDGSATTGSQNMPPVQPVGWMGTAGTGVLPAMVRPGVDPSVTGEICPLPECGGQRTDVAHKGKTTSWRRRHSSKMAAAYQVRDAGRAAVRDAAIASGERLAPGERKAARKAASVGSFSEGNVNGTVTHAPRPEFVPRGTRKPAPTQKHRVRSGKAE